MVAAEFNVGFSFSVNTLVTCIDILVMGICMRGGAYHSACDSRVFNRKISTLYLVFLIQGKLEKTRECYNTGQLC